MEGPSGSSSSGDSGESAGGGGGLTVGEQLPWPSADMEAGGGGGLDQEFEDSLGDFDEAVAGEAGAAGGEEEVDILSPLGQGSSAAQSDEPVYEEGDLAEEGGMAENQSIAQRAATGGGEGEGSSSSGGGAEGGASGEQSSGQQSESQAAAESGGGGAGALQGDRAVGAASAGAAMEGDEEIIPIPEDIGDGRNDDIVLRQIREAAMNESDPALREKLWDEYRRIRGAR